METLGVNSILGILLCKHTEQNALWQHDPGKTGPIAMGIVTKQSINPGQLLNMVSQK